MKIELSPLAAFEEFLESSDLHYWHSSTDAGEEFIIGQSSIYAYMSGIPSGAHGSVSPQGDENQIIHVIFDSEAGTMKHFWLGEV
jgi:hypothetical protein